MGGAGGSAPVGAGEPGEWIDKALENTKRACCPFLGTLSACPRFGGSGRGRVEWHSRGDRPEGVRTDGSPRIARRSSPGAARYAGVRACSPPRRRIGGPGAVAARPFVLQQRPKGPVRFLRPRACGRLGGAPLPLLSTFPGPPARSKTFFDANTFFCAWAHRFCGPRRRGRIRKFRWLRNQSSNTRSSSSGMRSSADLLAATGKSDALAGCGVGLMGGDGAVANSSSR